MFYVFGFRVQSSAFRVQGRDPGALEEPEGKESVVSGVRGAGGNKWCVRGFIKFVPDGGRTRDQ